MNALEYFKTYLKYEKYYKFRDAINKRFTKSLRRAEEIRAFLDGRAEEIRVLSYEDGASLNEGDDIVPGLVARPENRVEDWEGSGGSGEEDRAMEFRVILDEGGTSGAPLNGGDDIVSGLAARPKSKAEDGKGDGEENSKLRAALNSPTVRERPIAKSTRTQRLCSCFSGNP
ncbi:protein suppressor of K(+) transport growth defect 1 [Tanacetum coccineum]